MNGVDELLAEIEFWAEAHAGVGLVQAVQVRRLLEHVRELQSLVLAQGERIAQQSELLSRKAEANP
jgi:hypothetical protein